MSNLSHLAHVLGIKAEFVLGAAKTEPHWKGGAANNWRVTLTRSVKLANGKRQRRSLSLDFFGGAAVMNPTAADVLSAIASDARVGQEPWADFVSEFGEGEDFFDEHTPSELRDLGYDPTPLLVWKACKKAAPKVTKFLGADFDAIANAEH